MAINFERYKKTGRKVGTHNNPEVPDETVKLLMEKIKQGAGVRELAREYGIPKSTISNWVNGHNRIEATGGSLYEQMTKGKD